MRCTAQTNQAYREYSVYRTNMEQKRSIFVCMYTFTTKLVFHFTYNLFTFTKLSQKLFYNLLLLSDKPIQNFFSIMFYIL